MLWRPCAAGSLPPTVPAAKAWHTHHHVPSCLEVVNAVCKFLRRVMVLLHLTQWQQPLQTKERHHDPRRFYPDGLLPGRRPTGTAGAEQRPPAGPGPAALRQRGADPRTGWRVPRLRPRDQAVLVLPPAPRLRLPRLAAYPPHH